MANVGNPRLQAMMMSGMSRSDKRGGYIEPNSSTVILSIIEKVR